MKGRDPDGPVVDDEVTATRVLELLGEHLGAIEAFAHAADTALSDLPWVADPDQRRAAERLSCYVAAVVRSTAAALIDAAVLMRTVRSQQPPRRVRRTGKAAIK